jgi:hypothetical protein
MHGWLKEFLDHDTGEAKYVQILAS